jgi:hypothetical protein
MKIAAFVLIAALLGVATLSRAPVATITYYFISGCSTCARTSDALKKLSARYDGRVRLRLVDNHSPEGRAAVAQHHFASHGLVLTAADGSDALVEADHRVYAEHVDEALQRILPAPRP